MIKERSNTTRCAILIAASFVAGALFWIAFHSIYHMADTILIGIEANLSVEQMERTRWHFIKQEMGRVIGALTVPTLFASILLWKWVVFARDVTRRPAC
jgi:hypothetical protein